MRRNGWTRLAESVAAGRAVVPEDEILNALLLAGRRINKDFVERFAAQCGHWDTDGAVDRARTC